MCFGLLTDCCDIFTAGVIWVIGRPAPVHTGDHSAENRHVSDHYTVVSPTA